MLLKYSEGQSPRHTWRGQPLKGGVTLPNFNQSGVEKGRNRWADLYIWWWETKVFPIRWLVPLLEWGKIISWKDQSWFWEKVKESENKLTTGKCRCFLGYFTLPISLVSAYNVFPLLFLPESLPILQDSPYLLCPLKPFLKSYNSWLYHSCFTYSWTVLQLFCVVHDLIFMCLLNYSSWGQKLSFIKHCPSLFQKKCILIHIVNIWMYFLNMPSTETNILKGKW